MPVKLFAFVILKIIAVLIVFGIFSIFELLLFKGFINQWTSGTWGN